LVAVVQAVHLVLAAVEVAVEQVDILLVGLIFLIQSLLVLVVLEQAQMLAVPTVVHLFMEW
jgi:hypothetical protein